MNPPPFAGGPVPWAQPMGGPPPGHHGGAPQHHYLPPPGHHMGGPQGPPPSLLTHVSQPVAHLPTPMGLIPVPPVDMIAQIQGVPTPTITQTKQTPNAAPYLDPNDPSLKYVKFTFLSRPSSPFPMTPLPLVGPTGSFLHSEGSAKNLKFSSPPFSCAPVPGSPPPGHHGTAPPQTTPDQLKTTMNDKF